MSEPATRDKFRLGLTISNFACTPEDITALLELEPTSLSALRTKSRVPFWRAVSPVDPIGSDVEAQWRGFRLLLLPLTAKLKALSANATLEMDLGVISYDQHSGMRFPPDLVGFAAEINAALDIDLYCLKDAEQDRS